MGDLYVVVWMQVKEEASSAPQEYNTAEEREAVAAGSMDSGVVRRLLAVYVDHLQPGKLLHPSQHARKQSDGCLSTDVGPPSPFDGRTSYCDCVRCYQRWVRRLSAMHDTPILPIPAPAEPHRLFRWGGDSKAELEVSLSAHQAPSGWGPSTVGW